LASVTVGASATASRAAGVIPLVSETLARYRVLIGPTLAYGAADARATAFWLTAVLAVG
jgi:hypothetical protein